MARPAFLLRALVLLLLAAPSLVRAQTTDALLDTLQHSAFRYFWEQANPANGLVKDRNTPGSVASIASMGFGLSAYCIGVEHGWITRSQAAQRTLTMLNTLYNGPQSSAASGTIGYQGLFYHWLDMNTATRTWDSELSTIDTALLFAGMLDARQFFDGGDPTETQIRALADTIYRRANWNFVRNFNPGILMGWKPGTGFSGFGQWIGYNEAMILYLLALGSPTKSVPATAWDAWTSGYVWDTHYGYSYVTFPPLFGHQYSHCWVDFRNTRDAYMRARQIDYFENSRRATLAQRAYCAANPFGWSGYSDSLWGITAGDDPSGYLARGAPPAMNDNGTITPTAALSSIAFAPEAVIPVIRNLWNTYRPFYWGAYGWVDGWNPTAAWAATDVIGIDQGPILLMIENYRTGRVWARTMSHPDIQRGMQRAGFEPWVEGVDDRPRAGVSLSAPEPNPSRGRTLLRFRLPEPAVVRLAVYDVGGREVARLVQGPRGAGDHAEAFDSGALAGGVYWVRLSAGDVRRERRMVVLR